MGNGNMKPMGMGKKNGKWEQGMGTGNGEPEMENRK